MATAADRALRLKFYDHIRELRTRLLWCFLALFAGGVVGYVFRVRIINFLQHPLGAPLFYFNPAGSFNFIMQIAMFAGVLTALPFFLYHTVRFIEPALQVRIKIGALIVAIVSSFALSIGGIWFAYHYIIPESLRFFSDYSSAQVKPLIGANDYLSFILSSLVTFALIFQIPLIILFINRVRPLRPSLLLKYQRHIIASAFLLAVILPFTYDPVTQFIIAIPIVFLYYLSVILLFVFGGRPRAKPERQVVKLVEEPTPEPVKPQAGQYRLGRPASPTLDLRQTAPRTTQATRARPLSNVLDLSKMPPPKSSRRSKH